MNSRSQGAHKIECPQQGGQGAVCHDLVCLLVFVCVICLKKKNTKSAQALGCDEPEPLETAWRQLQQGSCDSAASQAGPHTTAWLRLTSDSRQLAARVHARKLRYELAWKACVETQLMSCPALPSLEANHEALEMSKSSLSSYTCIGAQWSVVAMQCALESAAAELVDESLSPRAVRLIIERDIMKYHEISCIS